MASQRKRLIYTSINTIYTGRQFILFWQEFVIPVIWFTWMQSNSDFTILFSNIANIDLFLYDLLKQAHCWVVAQANFFCTLLCGFNTINYFCRQKSGINAGTCETARDAQRAENAFSRRTHMYVHPFDAKTFRLWKLLLTPGARSAPCAERATRRESLTTWDDSNEKLSLIFLSKYPKSILIFFSDKGRAWGPG